MVGGRIDRAPGASVQFSNAETVDDLSGQFWNTSVSGGYIAGGTLDGFMGPSDHSTVTGVGFTLGEDTGASIIVGKTYTALTPSINLFGSFF